MKVTTKVAAGAALLVGILLVALARDALLVRSLASSHETLSRSRFAAVTTTLELLRVLELIEERQLKYFVTRDPAYLAPLQRFAETASTLVDRQVALGLPSDEHATAEGLAATWKTWRTTADARLGTVPRLAPVERDALRAQLVQSIDAVRGSAGALFDALRRGIERDVAQAADDAEEGVRTSRRFALAAALCAVVFVVVLRRSLNGPLARLVEATRTVAAGRYTRLPVKGSDELAQLGRAFDDMVARLDEVDRMKRDFLSHVSHELKTPLDAMQETTTLVADGLAGPLTEKQSRMLRLNLDAGRRLSSMLTRLLDVARLEAGAVTYDVRPVDVGALLAAAHHEFEARLADARIAATIERPETPVVIYGDRDWLVQLFDNLLENAVKHSPAGTTIRLALRVDAPPAKASTVLAPTGRCALVTVADEGPGVPAAERERVFERFYQADKRRRAGAGVGLGLTICRDIVRAHGGALWVEGEHGAVFVVALPLADEPESIEARA